LGLRFAARATLGGQIAQGSATPRLGADGWSMGRSGALAGARRALDDRGCGAVGRRPPSVRADGWGGPSRPRPRFHPPPPARGDDTRSRKKVEGGRVAEVASGRALGFGKWIPNSPVTGEKKTDDRQDDGRPQRFLPGPNRAQAPRRDGGHGWTPKTGQHKAKGERRLSAKGARFGTTGPDR